MFSSDEKISQGMRMQYYTFAPWVLAVSADGIPELGYYTAL